MNTVKRSSVPTSSIVPSRNVVPSSSIGIVVTPVTVGETLLTVTLAPSAVAAPSSSVIRTSIEYTSAGVPVGSSSRYRWLTVKRQSPFPSDTNEAPSGREPTVVSVVSAWPSSHEITTVCVSTKPGSWNVPVTSNVSFSSIDEADEKSMIAGGRLFTTTIVLARAEAPLSSVTVILTL